MSSARRIRGDDIAIEAHRLAQVLDPNQSGMDARELQRELVLAGFVVDGDNPNAMVDSALNRNQRLFASVMAGHWRWLRPDEVERPAVELSGAALAERAWEVMRAAPPSPGGWHYHVILGSLWKAGVHAKGPNEGQTLSKALTGSLRFRKVGRGIYQLS